MAKELPYFKFNVSEWIMGRISDEPDNIQGIFIQICCLYWSKSCQLRYENAIKRIHKLKVNALITRGFLKVVDGMIVISFLDEQFTELSKTQEKRVKAGLASVQARVQTKVEHLDKDVDKDKEIDKKNNIEERKLKFADTLKPFLEIYGREMLNDFYAYWTEPNQSGTKFRKEGEKHWSLEKRLNTWSKNELKFKKKDENKKPANTDRVNNHNGFGNW